MTCVHEYSTHVSKKCAAQRLQCLHVPPPHISLKDVYMCVGIYIYVYICICMCVYIYSMYVSESARRGVWIVYAPPPLHRLGCVCKYMYEVYIYIYIYIIYIRTCVHTYITCVSKSARRSVCNVCTSPSS